MTGLRPSWLLPTLLIAIPCAAPAQEDDRLVRALQSDLRRLAYYHGDIDGLESAGLSQALLSFERDEQLAPEAEPTPELLGLTHDAVGRIPAAGACPGDAAPAGLSMACGSIR